MAKAFHAMAARGQYSDLLGEKALQKKQEFILT